MANEDTTFVTKTDLQTAFLAFGKELTEQHETRIQMISGHYSDVLKSNKELTVKVCEISKKVDALILRIEPMLEAQETIISIRNFMKWIGLPFTAIGLAFYWLYKNI